MTTPRTDAQSLVNQAIAEGRHSTTWSTVCDGCGQWVEAIYTIVPGTRKRLCRKCCSVGTPATQDLANAVSRSSRGERSDAPTPNARRVEAALPNGQANVHGAASQAASLRTADARTGGVETAPRAGMLNPRPEPTSTVACLETTRAEAVA